ncbi:MAG: NERD domain-containing protein [Opitutaceae bacterium]|nr:NERD domain-containing protein [Opitutaceae bacterium]
MNNFLNGTVILCGYFILFLCGVLGFAVWQIKRRREKRPLEFKLLRGPGETLRRRMNKFDENFFFQVAAAALAPICTGLITLSLLQWLAPQIRLSFGIAAMAVVFLVTLVASAQWTIRRFMRDRNDRLGYLGERAVGETLVPLIASGYRVYHDLPAGTGPTQFNIDHVAVGPNGIFAIETKSRRKRPARPGHEAHKVIYDGKMLIWPWAEETTCLEQASSRARWLGEWLQQLTGIEPAVQPVLVLPGWYVVPKGLGPVLVVNHKLVADAIERETRTKLTDDQIDLISRQIEQRCRDVED